MGFCWFIAEPEGQIGPPPNRPAQTTIIIFIFCRLCQGKQTGKQAITVMLPPPPPPPFQPCMWKLPLCLLHCCYARSKLFFSISPCQLPPRSPRPSTFPGDFISPISNWIKSQFSMPRVTSCYKIPHLIQTHHKKKYDSSETFPFPLAICHFWHLFDWDWRRAIGQTEVSIKERTPRSDQCWG